MRARIDARLGELAVNEPADVAAVLLFAGAVGTRSHCGACPVAVFLAVEGVDSVVAGKRFLVVNYKVGRRWAAVEYQTPAVVAAFMRAFDRGAYPYLEVKS